MNRTRWLATAAAGLAVVLGGSAALAASGSSDPASDFLGDVSKRLGISKDKLEGAIEDASIARIDEAVDAGDLTKEEGDALKERVRSGDGPVILPGLRPGFGPLGPPDKGFHHGGFPGIDLVGTAADYLGIDLADVREALHDGKSLADLAKDKGKSVDGLKGAMRDRLRKDADKAVDDGALSKEEADRIVDKLSSAVDDLVDRTGGPHLAFGLRGPGDGPRGLGFGVPGPPDKGFFHGGFPGFDLIGTAAAYLGVDAADVREALHDGKSLADLARDRGKSVDGLKGALRDAIRKDADRAAERLESEIDKLVEGNFELHLRGRPD